MCLVRYSSTGGYKNFAHGGIAFVEAACFWAGSSLSNRNSLPLALFLHALEKSYRRAEEIKTLAQLVLEEPLVAEMQPLRLIRKDNKRRRRCSRLRDV